MTEEPNTGLPEETDRLREAAARSNDPRLNALSIAAADDRIVAILTDRLSKGYPYSGTLVMPRGDRVHVLFSFMRQSGQFGLIPLQTLAVVDPNEGRVTRVIEN